MKKNTVAITGGLSGIGLAMTELFLKKGYNVAVLTRTLNPSHLMESDNLLIIQGDVRKTDDLDYFYQQCQTEFSGLDVVIANAGIAKQKPSSHVTEAFFDETMDINVKGVFFTVQRAIPHLSSGASIILVSSIQAQKGAGIWSVYGASKAAVRSLARSFAQELGEQGVRVNSLSPGVTETPIFNKFGFKDEILNDILINVINATPLRRIGTPEEIAEVAWFLASEDSRFMTGSDVQVDGGLIQI